jgi:hypothetical protein
VGTTPNPSGSNHFHTARLALSNLVVEGETNRLRTDPAYGSEVPFFDGATFKLTGERSVRGRTLCKQDNAAGVSVEALVNPQVRICGPIAFGEEQF